MRDFTQFDIIAKSTDDNKVRFTMRHKRREAVAVDFTTGATLNALHLPALIAGVIKSYLRKYRAASRKAMTRYQKNFYDKLVEFHRTEGRAPTYEEQCVFLGVSSKGTPHYYVKKLEELGWVWVDNDGMAIPIDIAMQEHLEE